MDKRFITEKIMNLIISLICSLTYMDSIAITYGVVSLLLLGGFAYMTIRMTSRK